MANDNVIPFPGRANIEEPIAQSEPLPALDDVIDDLYMRYKDSTDYDHGKDRGLVEALGVVMSAWGEASTRAEVLSQLCHFAAEALIDTRENHLELMEAWGGRKGKS